eukprot:COSAG04_NODE_1328_length_7204_cov_249.095303_2_plen_280_part_00
MSPAEPVGVAFCVPVGAGPGSISQDEWMQMDSIGIADRIEGSTSACVKVMEYAGCGAAASCANQSLVSSECRRCKEIPPYSSWQRRALHTEPDTMARRCHDQRGCAFIRDNSPTYRPAETNECFNDCTDVVKQSDQRQERQSDLFVAVWTAALTLTMALHAYFDVDRRLSLQNSSRQKLHAVNKTWRTWPRKDPELLDHKSELVDQTEKAFMLLYDALHEVRTGASQEKEEEDDGVDGEQDEPSADIEAGRGARRLPGWPGTQLRSDGEYSKLTRSVES